MESLNLNNISIQNFLIHQNTVINLKKLTIISGPNGSGKSSILDALNFVITGGTTKTRARDIRINDIIQKGSAQAQVTVTGTLGTTPMTLTRTRSKSTKAKMTLGSREISEPDVRLGDLVASNEFDRVIQVNGHTLSHLLSGTPSAVSEMFDSLFGVDVVRGIRGRIKMSAVDNRIKQIRFEIEKTREALAIAQQMGNVAAQRDRLLQERTRLEADVQRITEEVAESQAHFNEMKEKEDEYKRFTLKQQQFKSERDALHNLIRANQEKLLQLRQERDDLTSAVTQLLGGFDSVQTMDAKIEQIGIDIAEKIRHVAQQDTVPTVIDLIGRMIDEDASGSCPCCGKEFGTELTSDVLNGLKDRSSRTKTAAELEIEQMKEEKAHHQNSRNRVLTVQSDLEKVKSQIQLIEKQTDENQKRSAATEQALLVLNQSSTTNDFDPEHLRELDMKITELTTTRNGKNSRIRAIDNEVTSVPSSSSTRAPSTAELERLEGKCRALEQFKASLLDIQNGFARIMRSMRSGIVEKLNDRINRFLAILSPNGYITNVQFSLTPKKVKDKEYYHYTMHLETANGNKTLESLSTGQMTLVMLGLIFALNEIQQPCVDFIMFDEPDETIDAQVQEKLAEILVAMAQRKKVIITTRSNEFKQKIADIALSQGVTNECAFYDCSIVNQGTRKVSNVVFATA